MSPGLGYPAAPTNVPTSMTEVSVQFKKEVKNVIAAIVLFFIVYILLLITSVLLSVACIFLGVQVIIAFPKFITLMLGLGLMGLGLSLVFFLIKFIFAVNKSDETNLLEIKEEEQPRLFAFIRQLSEETQTKFPKKIFISPDVNASVFYNSSFWSMFLPVRKNLVIGAGLVNSINLSEFKAVIAHEFGHFSQRSMKLGSFTYNVNKIIYNMLYENNGFNNILSKWGNLHGAISIFVGITVYIANAIIAILKKMYELINKRYMSLSRQMEFHADSIAASVAGGNNLISALRRIQLASTSYNIALERAGEWLKKKAVSNNIYRNQFSVLKVIATENNLTVRNGLPVISTNFLNSIESTRVNFEDQYASHPTRADREAHLNSLGIDIVGSDESAWVVFENPELVQKMMTANLYRNVAQEEGNQHIDEITFEQDYLNVENEYKLPEEYCGFYSGRLLTKFDVDSPELSERKTVHKNDFNSLFNDAGGNLYKKLRSNENDLETLKAIEDKRINVQSFDFDGEKYSRTDTCHAIAKLDNEITEQRELLAVKDKEAYSFFFNLSTASATEELKVKYRQLFDLSKLIEDYVANANNIVNACNSFFQEQVTIELATSTAASIKKTYEPELKFFFLEILTKGIVDENSELGNKMKKFNDSHYAYFHDNSFHNEDIQELYQLTLEVADFLNDYRYKEYKKLLQFQLEIYKQAA